MNKIVISVVCVLLLIITIGGIGMSSSNKEVKLKNKVEAQKKVCEAYYDKLWKVISQKAQVAEQYKSTFKEIYPQLIEGRYGNEKGGSLMKFVTESNPTFDVSLYKDLMQSIEAERQGFFLEQEKLVDINREHNDVLSTLPSSIFVGSRPKIEIKIVSSEATKKIMESGEENNIDVFKK